MHLKLIIYGIKKKMLSKKKASLMISFKIILSSHYLL